MNEFKDSDVFCEWLAEILGDISLSRLITIQMIRIRRKIETGSIYPAVFHNQSVMSLCNLARS